MNKEYKRRFQSYDCLLMIYNIMQSKYRDRITCVCTREVVSPHQICSCSVPRNDRGPVHYMQCTGTTLHLYSVHKVKVVPFILISAKLSSLFHMHCFSTGTTLRYSLLHNLSVYGLSRGYLSLYHVYLTNRQSCARFSSVITSCRLPQSQISVHCTFNIFINDLHEVINQLLSLLCADDLTDHRPSSDRTTA